MRGIQLWLKRALDFVVSAAALVLLSPLLLSIAVAIKLTSPGPVLFRQSRLGLYGHPFQIVKFRTMVVNAEHLAPRSSDGANHVTADDPRITAVGAMLREWSLDELPQFWNVIRGDMSLVGPRPDEASAASLYTSAQRQKLQMRPGITGLAMIRGRNSISWAQRIAYDIEYIRRFSLWLDLVIALKTVLVLLSRQGLYNPINIGPVDQSAAVPEAKGRISVSVAGTDDALDIWTWRNDSLSRAMSRNTELISWETHAAWYSCALADPDRHIFIGRTSSGEKIGMCRFDIAPSGQTAEVSLVLKPSARGLRLSGELLSAAIGAFSAVRKLRLIAAVRKRNTASIRCFQGCGFTSYGEEHDFFLYSLEIA